MIRIRDLKNWISKETEPKDLPRIRGILLQLSGLTSVVDTSVDVRPLMTRKTKKMMKVLCEASRVFDDELDAKQHWKRVHAFKDLRYGFSQWIGADRSRIKDLLRWSITNYDAMLVRRIQKLLLHYTGAMINPLLVSVDVEIQEVKCENFRWRTVDRTKKQAAYLSREVKRCFENLQARVGDLYRTI